MKKTMKIVFASALMALSAGLANGQTSATGPTDPSATPPPPAPPPAASWSGGPVFTPTTPPSAGMTGCGGVAGNSSTIASTASPSGTGDSALQPGTSRSSRAGC
jgi:hypothetical protein